MGAGHPGSHWQPSLIPLASELLFRRRKMHLVIVTQHGAEERWASSKQSWIQGLTGPLTGA